MKRREVVYAFIDASNIIYGAKAEGWFIDQEKLFAYLKRKFKIKKEGDPKLESSLSFMILL